MQSVTKAFMIGVVVLCVVTLGGSTTWGAGSPEPPPGEPPHGVALQSNAAGTKLTGVLFLEFQEVRFCGGPVAETARLVLRLSKGNDLQLFTDVIDCTTNPSVCRTPLPDTGCGPTPPPLIDLSKIPDIQNALTTAVQAQILDFFFGTTALGITVTRLPNFETIDDPSTPPFTRFVVSDVELAVK